MENFKEKFDQLLVDTLSISQEQITPESKFIEDFGADSLDMVELVMQFETVFKITVPDEDVEQIKTVADAEKYIINKMKIGLKKMMLTIAMI